MAETEAMKTLYLAGKMRGIRFYNFPAFDEAAMSLELRGYEVINPAELDRQRGFHPELLGSDYDWNSIPEGFDMDTCIRADIDGILKADAICVLPGWQESTGAKAEIGIAMWAGKDVLYYNPGDGNAHVLATGTGCETKPTNPKDRIGSTKLPLDLIPATAAIEECLAFLEGAEKYGAYNYRAIGVRASIYIAACKRHIDKWINGEERDANTGVHHLGSARACLGIILDAASMGKLTDDRPPANPEFSRLVDAAQDRVKHLKALFANEKPRHYTIADTEEG